MKNENHENKNISILEDARKLFQSLSLDEQLEIKNNKPKVYEAIFTENDILVNRTLLDNFFNDYQPLIDKIQTFEDFQALDLDTQLRFKQNHQEQYNNLLK